MWVEKNASGSYKFSERYKDPLTGKLRKVTISLPKKTKFETKKAQIALEAKIHKRLQQVQDGNIKRGITLGQVIDEWEPIYKSQVKENTWTTFEPIKKHIKKYIGFDTLVDKITPKYLAHIYEDMLYKYGFNNAPVKNVKSKMTSILKFAYKRDYVSTAPVRVADVKWKPEKQNKIANKFLETDEAKAVLNYVYMHNEQQGAIFEWQYLTGMRIGEVLGMQVKNIVKENDQYFANVTGTVLYTGRKINDYIKQGSTKTASGQRSVLLPKRAVEIYDKWKQGKKPNDFLFMHNNQFFSYTTLNRQLDNAKCFLHINKKLTTHTFRHTHVSELAALGVPLYIIEDRIGHANSATIREVYLHVTHKAKSKFDDTILNLK